MKVLQLGKFYPIKGGVEKVIFDLANGVSGRKINCDILCAYVGGGSSPKRIEINELSTAYIDSKVCMLASTAISPKLVMHLRRLCNDYDIIHIHHPDPMVALALFLSGYRGIVVLHWHSDILRQKTLLRLYKPIQNWLIKRSKIILGTTPKYVEESPFLKDVQYKVDSLPIGVTTQVPDRSLVSRIKDRYQQKKIILSIGRLVEYKGLKYLIEAAAFLDDDFVLLIAGVGPLYKQLQYQITKLGLENKVILLGYISDSEKWAYYHACTLFCLPSIYKTEAFGIVQVEAMSCGKPIVATNIEGSGTSWVNQDGISGLNVQIGEPRQIVDAINTICNDENYYSFCTRAKKRYEEIFTEKEMIDRCISIYDRLINQ